MRQQLALQPFLGRGLLGREQLPQAAEPPLPLQVWEQWPQAQVLGQPRVQVGAPAGLRAWAGCAAVPSLLGWAAAFAC